MSFALNLTVADSLSVDYVEQKLITNISNLLNEHKIFKFPKSKQLYSQKYFCIYLQHHRISLLSFLHRKQLNEPV